MSNTITVVLSIASACIAIAGITCLAISLIGSSESKKLHTAIGNPDLQLLNRNELKSLKKWKNEQNIQALLQQEGAKLTIEFLGGSAIGTMIIAKVILKDGFSVQKDITDYTTW